MNMRHCTLPMTPASEARSVISHHQFLTQAIWRCWVRINYLHCSRSFVKSAASHCVCPHDVNFSFILHTQCSLGLPLFLPLLDLSCCVLSGTLTNWHSKLDSL